MTALSFEDVSVVSEGRRVLDRVSFQLAEGARLAIVGPNGGGKTVIARIAAGLLAPTSGSVRVFGQSWADGEVLPELRRRVGVGLAQGCLLSDLTASENVREAMGMLRPSGERRARLKVDRALVDAGVEHCAGVSAPRLSVGERRRVDLARVLVSDPDLLILDDVLTGIHGHGAADLEMRIGRLVSRRRRALLWLGGDRASAERLTDRVLDLEHGRLAPASQHAAA